jgi:hypothetical protein
MTIEIYWSSTENRYRLLLKQSREIDLDEMQCAAMIMAMEIVYPGLIEKVSAFCAGVSSSPGPSK